MKILHLECGGLVIYQMKLESGTFKLPVFDEESHTFKTSWQELMLMVRGLDIDKNTRKKRWEKRRIYTGSVGRERQTFSAECQIKKSVG